MRVSTATTWIGAVARPSLGTTPSRSTVATNELAATGTPFGAK